MGNINIITDKDEKILGQIDLGLRSFNVVYNLIKKYNPNKPYVFPSPDNIDALVEPCYKKGRRYEIIQLLVFINDISTFTKKDIRAFNEAIKRTPYVDEDRGPQHVLIFLRDLIKKYGEIIKTYQSTYCAITVTKE